jgi:hypothetical protein
VFCVLASISLSVIFLRTLSIVPNLSLKRKKYVSRQTSFFFACYVPNSKDINRNLNGFFNFSRYSLTINPVFAPLRCFNRENGNIFRTFFFTCGVKKDLDSIFPSLFYTVFTYDSLFTPISVRKPKDISSCTT